MESSPSLPPACPQNTDNQSCDTNHGSPCHCTSPHKDGKNNSPSPSLNRPPTATTNISTVELEELVKFFASDQAQNKQHPTSLGIQSRVRMLFERDYYVSGLDNSQGQYCNSYPADLLILENHKTGPYAVDELTNQRQKINDAQRLKLLFRESRFSRVHGRFAVPTILCRTKNISRSSTLAIQAEAMYNNAKEFLGTL